MKLGIITHYDKQGFETAKKYGLEYVEFVVNVGTDVEDFVKLVPTLMDLSKEYNIGISSVGRFGTDRINKEGNVIEEELINSYKLIDAIAELGCTNFVCGCNYVDELSFYQNCTAAIEYFTKVVEYSKKKGVKVSTYNCRWNNFVHSDPVWTIIHGHIKDLGIKFDPSHSIYDSGDYLSEMKKWGNRFYHVHIKGSLLIDGERFDDPPAGLDNTNWGAFMSVLYACKYDGVLSIEPHSHNWNGELGDKGIEYTVNYMKKLVL